MYVIGDGTVWQGPNGPTVDLNLALDRARASAAAWVPRLHGKEPGML